MHYWIVESFQYDRDDVFAWRIIEFWFRFFENSHF